MVRSGLMVSCRDTVAVRTGDELSDTDAVKLKAPAASGIPVRAPAAESVNPPGNVPEATDHVYGAVPPVADKFCE